MNGYSPGFAIGLAPAAAEMPVTRAQANG